MLSLFQIQILGPYLAEAPGVGGRAGVVSEESGAHMGGLGRETKGADRGEETIRGEARALQGECHLSPVTPGGMVSPTMRP